MAIESRYLAFHGIRVHFSVMVPEKEITNRLLLLCSPVMNTFNWRKLLPELSELGCLTVSVDLPGFGKSSCDPGAPQSILQRANIVWGILDEVDSMQNAPLSLWHLCGHGSACSTILKMARLYPESVKSQIHLSPVFYIPLPESREKTEKQLIRTFESPERFRKTVENAAAHTLDEFILEKMRKPFERENSVHTCLRALKVASTPPTEGMGFTPTMAIWGSNDPIITGVVRDKIHELLPEAEIHKLVSAGHYPMETHSKALRDYLRGWFKYNE
ncbi:MAG: alpha/beta hydrolase [Clostridia bacterium]|nr:alpha/beta hydrolase [Clostridia bacterium]